MRAILLACGLDALLGDPRWLPHPVRAIGALAAWAESSTRARWPARCAGIVTWLLVIGGTVTLAGALLRGAGAVSSRLGALAGAWMIYTTIAARDLAGHSGAVRRALLAADLPEAQRLVGRMVGRDTADLDEAGVARAAVESVAENLVDGVTAPLFYALLLGPLGALAYRAVNTLDSLFGYRNERYGRFGWLSARADDVANWLPARLTAPLLCLAAPAIGGQVVGAWRVLRRDGRRHASPNSGLAEAAMAGALGVQLGGPSHYGGVLSDKPTLGEPRQPLTADTIRVANRLMVLSAGLFVAAGQALRALCLEVVR